METLRHFFKSMANLFKTNKPRTIVLKRKDEHLEKDNLARIYIRIK